MLTTVLGHREMEAEYARALRAYLQEQSEHALVQAYELGRQALTAGVSVVEMVAMHGRVMAEVLASVAPVAADSTAQVSELGCQFLADCMSPYEMTLRGFRESVTRLRKTNDALQERAAELAEANETIQVLTRARTDFLADAGRHLVATLDYEQTLRTVAEIGIGQVSQYAFLDLRERGGPRRILSAGFTEDSELSDAQKRALDDAAAKVLELGKGDGPRPDLLASRALIVPLSTRNRILGALALVNGPGRVPFGPDDVTLVEELARRAAMAIDNARLFREAQEAVQLRETFLSVASHELKTPLTPLRLTLQSVLKRVQAGTPVPPENLERTLRYVERLNALVADLLDVSRMQAGAIKLHRTPVSLSAVLKEAVQVFQDSAPRHRVVLEQATDVTVDGDAFRLEQVIANLLDNAVKYSPTGGEVRVALLRREDRAVLRIADDGIGIPKAQQAGVFDRFFRAENASQTNYGGLGLGLFICKNIIEAHGGRIWFESDGPGATFFVSLPAHGGET